MINYKAAFLLIANFPWLGSMIFADSGVAMAPSLMFAWGACCGFVGGFAAASKTNHKKGLDKLIYCLVVAANTGIFGAGFAVGSVLWSEADYQRQWTIIGLTCILSLGGLSTVEWAFGLAKKIAARQADEQSKK